MASVKNRRLLEHSYHFIPGIQTTEAEQVPRDGRGFSEERQECPGMVRDGGSLRGSRNAQGWQRGL